MEESTTQRPTIRQGPELDAFLGRLAARGSGVAFVVALSAIVQMVWHGTTDRHWWLLAGSVLSVGGLMGFAASIAADAGAPRKGALRALLGLGGFIPYLFGTYLTLYEGLWGLVRVFGHFSVGGAIVPVLYTVGGYMLIQAIYRLTEFGRALDEGRIRVQVDTP